MKTLLILSSACLLAVSLHAQTTVNSTATPISSETLVGYQIGGQDGNSRHWQKMVKVTDARGNFTVQTNDAYVEIANGLNYWDESGQQWLESKEEIDAYPDGAIAQYGQHKVIFANNLNTVGAIDLQMSNGKELKSHILGLGYYDPASGKSVLIAQIKDCQGQIANGNQVVYADAFEGVHADVRYTYKRGSFEQDVILQSRPPAPESFGLSSRTAVLQVLTEFDAAPEPSIKAAATLSAGGLMDQRLDFGAMKMVQGRAFGVRQNPLDGVRVSKQWQNVSGRTILIESLPVASITNQLNGLAMAGSSHRHARTAQRAAAGKNSNLNIVSSKRLLPAPQLAKAARGKMKLARVSPVVQGLVLDYVTIDSHVGTFTFESGTTYYVNGDFFAESVSLEAGAVIKFSTSSSMEWYGGGPGDYIDCDTTPDHPAIFTAVDDDTVGETISGSTGTPSGYYAQGGGSHIGGISFDTGVSLHDLRMKYMQQAFYIEYPASFDDVQFVDCDEGIEVATASIKMNNCLFGNVVTVFGGSQLGLAGTQLTFDQFFGALASEAELDLTNCLVIPKYSLLNPYAGITIFTNAVVKLSSDSGIFQTAAAANYYLTNGSPYRNVGTTSIASSLLAELQQMTTYAPPDGGWPDTNAPDLGYHYPVNEDSDFDGLPDWWEWKYFGDYTHVGSELDRSEDTYTLLYDYNHGINPNILRTMTVGWGGNIDGQCDVPTGLTNVIQVAAGAGHSLVLKGDGMVEAWGLNDHGQCNVPTNLVGVAMVSAGWDFSVALLTNGTVTAWGLNLFNLLNVPADLTNAIIISAGTEHTVALRSNGTVVAWGYNSAWGETNVPAGLTNVTAISAGFGHSLAVSNGYVVAWGYNGYGQCTVPSGLSNVVDVAAGLFHSLALLNNGTVVAWGHSAYGETSVPAGLTNVVAIAAGGDDSLFDQTAYGMALKSDGTVVTWGNSEVVDPMGGLNNVIAINGGADHALAIRTGPATPVITLEPVDAYQVIGGTATFTARGAGLYGVTYQWQTNGVNLAGATNAALTLTNVQLGMEGPYKVVVTDNGGMGSIASSNASLSIVTPPVITSKTLPTNILALYQTNLTLSVTATAPGISNGFPLGYQWQLNGTNISGQTASNYTFVVTNAGTYSLIVSNAAGGTNAAWQVTVDYGTLAYYLSTNTVGYANGYSPTFSNMLELANWTSATYSGTNLALLTNAVWSTNCWLHGMKGLSATCIGYSNGFSGQFLVTMVSPRHYLMASHVGIGAMVTFLDTNNVIYWRTNVQRVDIGNDTSVGILNADLPSSVGYLPVIPANFTNYLPTTSYVQGIGLHQDLRMFSQPMTLGNPFIFWDSSAAPLFGLGTSWNITLFSGDSSNPEMFLINNQFVLVTHNYVVTGGPNYAYQIDAINQQMHYLSTNNVVGTDYQLSQFSLTNWPTIH